MDQYDAVWKPLTEINFNTNSGKSVNASSNSFDILLDVFAYCIPHCFKYIGKPKVKREIMQPYPDRHFGDHHRGRVKTRKPRGCK